MIIFKAILAPVQSRYLKIIITVGGRTLMWTVRRQGLFTK